MSVIIDMGQHFAQLAIVVNERVVIVDKNPPCLRTILTNKFMDHEGFGRQVLVAIHEIAEDYVVFRRNLFATRKKPKD